jgi:hypothetical protein
MSARGQALAVTLLWGALTAAAPAAGAGHATLARTRSCGAIGARYSVKVLGGPVGCRRARRAARRYLRGRQTNGWLCRQALNECCPR